MLESGATSSRSRKASVSSFQRDKYGLRQMAKAFTKSLVIWGPEHDSGSGAGVLATETDEAPPAEQMENNSDNRENDIQKRFNKKIENTAAFQPSIRDSSRVPLGENFNIGNMDTLRSYGSNNHTYNNNNDINNNNINSNNGGGSNRRREPEYSLGIANKQLRKLVITRCPPNVGVSTVVSFICGGSLEKIVPTVVHHKDADEFQILELVVTFMDAKRAQSFYEFAHSGLFLIAGKRVKVEWCHEQPRGSSNVETGACRCSILKRTHSAKSGANLKPKRGIGTYMDCRPYCCDFDFRETYQDFSQYGPICEVTPAVSRKLCVAIFYYDVKSAMMAKKHLEDESSKLGQKYKEWTVWYGKDCTDKACIDF